MLERVSPPVIVLDPPEKLVIETRASGGYQRFNWFRNGSLYNPSPSAPFHVVVPDEFPNFFEVFAREPTTTDDLGVYEAGLQVAFGQPTVRNVEFVVTRYGKDHKISIYQFTLRTPVPNHALILLVTVPLPFSCTSNHESDW